MYTESMARSDFDQALFRGTLSEIFSRLKGKRDNLLSFSEIIEIVRSGKNESYKGVQPILIDDIIGSEGRYNDFNKNFLPKSEFLRGRWESIARAHYESKELPPIQVYKLSKVYFVRDGNHRVSVAKRKGNEFIDAEITEITTEFEIRPDMSKEQLIRILLEHERNKFLECTGLAAHRDVKKLIFTFPGRFDEILAHIDGHKYFLNLQKETSFEESLVSWYDNLFIPILTEIEKSSILYQFPKRTSADLYVWIIRHWHDLKERFGEHVQIKDAIISYQKFKRKGEKSAIGSLFRNIKDLTKKNIMF